GSVFEHSWIRLPEVVISGELSDAVGMVSAGHHSVEVGVLERQPALDFRLNRFKVVPLIVPSSDARLICDENRGNAAFIELAHRGRSRWDHRDFVEAVEVVRFFDDHAITIQKYRETGISASRRQLAIKAGINQQVVIVASELGRLARAAMDRKGRLQLL